jgi:hypothetical protein
MVLTPNNQHANIDWGQQAYLSVCAVTCIDVVILSFREQRQCTVKYVYCMIILQINCILNSMLNNNDTIHAPKIHDAIRGNNKESCPIISLGLDL